MLRNYFTLVLRNLLRNPTYTLINLVGLALGMASSLLIYSNISYHLSFDTFHPTADRIYRLVTEQHGEGVSFAPAVPSPLGKAFRNDFALAEKVARVISFDNALISLPADQELKKFEEKQGVAFVEPAFFDILRFPLAQGNHQVALSEPNSAVITARLAGKYFPGESALGKTIYLNDKIAFTIQGILRDLPANTDRKQEIYLSYANLKDQAPGQADEQNWGGIYSGSHCFVLLKPGVSATTVEKALLTLNKKYYQGEDQKVFGFKVQPLSDVHFNPRFGGSVEKKNLWALAIVGLFLMVTAGVNFVNLATAQALKRGKEVGVRKVLGSSRGQLFGQFMAETTLITFLAVLLGYGLARLGLPYVNQLFTALVDTHLTLNPFQDWRLLAFMGLLTVLVACLSGFYPSLVLTRFQPVPALKGQLLSAPVGGFGLRRVLVVIQFTISQALLIGTLVIVRQMDYAKQSNLGFTKDAVVMLPIPSKDQGKMNTLRTRLAQVPGVDHVSLCLQAPAASANAEFGVSYDNRLQPEPFSINLKAADAQYLPTFGLQLVAGRNILSSDTTREYLVNETFVRKLNLILPREVIGKELNIDGKTAPIVGVVKDFYNNSFRQDISAICITSNDEMYDNCAVKLNLSSAKSTLASVEERWNDAYPESVYSFQFLDERIAAFYQLDEIMLGLIKAFSVMAIFIGCLGLYGLVSFMAVQKTKEIGIRKVLGADIGHIWWLFGREFARLIAVAFVMAAPLAYWVMHQWLQDFVYRSPISGGVFLVTVSATLLLAAMTVGYQSIKAALANPIDSLRTE